MKKLLEIIRAYFKKDMFLDKFIKTFIYKPYETANERIVVVYGDKVITLWVYELYTNSLAINATIEGRCTATEASRLTSLIEDAEKEINKDV